MAAVERTGIPKKFYLTAMRGNRFARIREILEEQGVELPPMPERPPEWVKKMEAQEARINTVVNIAPFVEQKLDSAPDARQSDPGLVLEQDPDRGDGGDVRRGELHPRPSTQRRGVRRARGRSVHGLAIGT